MFRLRILLSVFIVAALVCGPLLGTALADAATADDLFQQGMKQFSAGDLDGASETFRQIDPFQITSKDDRVTLYETMQEIDRRLVHSDATKLLEDARKAYEVGQYEDAVRFFEAVQAGTIATEAQKSEAAAGLADTRRVMGAPESQAKLNIDKAAAQIRENQLDSAQQLLSEVKASGLDLGWFDNERVDRLFALLAERRTELGQLAQAVAPEPSAPIEAGTPAPPPAVEPAVVQAPVQAAEVPQAQPKPQPKEAAKTPAAAMPEVTIVPYHDAGPKKEAPQKPAPKPAPKKDQPPTAAPKTPPVPAAPPVKTAAAPRQPEAAKPPAAVKPVPEPAPVAAADQDDSDEEPARHVLGATDQDVEEVSINPVTPPASSPGTAAAAARPSHTETTAVQAQAQPATNDVLSQFKILYAQQKLAEAKDAVNAGQFYNAKKLLEEGLASDPGNAQIAAALTEVQTKIDRELGPRDILDTHIQNYQLAQQAIEAEFKESMTRAESLLASNSFSAANEAVQQAKITVDRKQAVLPASTYKDLRQQAVDLAARIAQGQRAFQAGQLEAVEKSREEQTRQARLRILEEQQKEVEKLLRRAADLRREQKYEKSIEYLTQALFLDPNNVAAQAMKEMIEDTMVVVKYRDTERKRALSMSKAQLDNLDATIPYDELMIYPADWPEITYRRLKGLSQDTGESEINRRVAQKLKETVPIRFDKAKLESVIDFLRNTTGLNFFVNWAALAGAGVQKDQPINLQLVNIPAEQALRLILQQATPVAAAIDAGDINNPITFSIIEGVITISTQEDLTKTTETRVYDIRDLLVSVPTFGNVPDFDLTTALSSSGNAAGGGGGGGGGGSSIFGSTAETQNQAPEKTYDERVKQITDLIYDTVGKATDWIEKGGAEGSMKELNGNLIVKTTPQNHRQMIQLLAQLRETRAMQIAVEGRFLLVDQNFLEEVGVDLDIQQDLGNGLQPIKIAQDAATLASRGTTGLPGSFGTPDPGSALPTQGPLGPFIPGTGYTVGANRNAARSFDMALTYLDDLQVNLLIRASQAKRSSISLTAPRITFFNGQKAHVLVARQVAFVSDLEPVPNSGGFDVTLSVVQAGVVLVVEGTISADRRYVTLTVQPSLASLIRPIRTIALESVLVVEVNGVGVPITSTANVEAPEIELTQIKTTVSVPDRGTLLLGGQRLVGEVEIESGVPVLSKVPLINRFFTNSSKVKDERTLLVLIKPTIILQNEEEDQRFPGLLQDPGKFNVGRESFSVSPAR